MIGAIGHWLNVNVVGNLTANLLWATPTFLHLHYRLNRQQDQIIKATRQPVKADKLPS